MNEKKNLDRLFQEKFKDFEVAPPEFVWENIQEILQEKKKRRVIPIWFKLSGVAALLVLSGLLATLFFNDSQNPATNAPAVVLDKTTATPANNPAAPAGTTVPSATSDAQTTNASQTETAVASGGEQSTSNNNKNAAKGLSLSTDATLPVVNSRENAVASQQKTNNVKNNTVNTTSSTNTTLPNKTNILPNNQNNAVAEQANTANKQNNKNKTENTVAPMNQGTAVATSQTVKNNTNNGAVASPIAPSANINNNGGINKNAEDALAAAKLRSAAKNYAKNPNDIAPANKSNAANNTITDEGIADAGNNTTTANKNAATQNANGNTPPNGIAANGTDTASGKNPANAVNAADGKNNIIIDRAIPVTNEVAETTIDSAKIVPENELEKLLQEKLKGTKEEDKAVAETHKNRWNVKPQVAPVFYNSLGSGSPINAQFASNSKSYDNELSIGVGVNYALSDRISIRSGVNSVNLSYATNGIAFYASLNGNTDNIGVSKAAGNIVVQNPGDVPSDPLLINGVANQLTTGSMVQKTGYVEVPLEMSYAVVNSKFGIDVIGGVSTLFLNQNNVSVVSSTGLSTQVGEAQNLNNVHFSTNVGLGFKYRFWDSFQANFEPMFKYQVNAYSRDAGNFKPYFIGLYTGVSFSF